MGKDTCVESPEVKCKFCLLLTPEQKAQLAAPSYKLKKEKRVAKILEISSTPSKDGTLVDPATVSVIGAVSDTVSVSSPPYTVPEKKAKKDKQWSDRFNHLETLLMPKTHQPTFSSAVKVTPISLSS